MKPLTIEQLKSLEVGDWVWVVMLQDAYRPTDVPYGEYHRVVGSINPYYFMVSGSNEFNYYKLAYSDYGETWTAYKNKEMAESKGEIVEIKGTCEHCVHNILKGCYNHGINEPKCEYTTLYLKYNDYCSHFEPERRLAELKK